MRMEGQLKPYFFRSIKDNRPYFLAELETETDSVFILLEINSDFERYADFVGIFINKKADYSNENLDSLLRNKFDLSIEKTICRGNLFSLSLIDNLMNTLSKSFIKQNCFQDFSPIAIKYNEKLPITKVISRHDILDAYPYDFMNNFLELLKEVALNKCTKSISISIYRLAEHPRIYEYLIKEAKNGIKVTILIELKARFDEASNIEQYKVG